jgi:hypothetical protein
LLGRMLVEGKPPTKTKPPLAMGGPAWELLPEGDPFTGGVSALGAPTDPA